jgi:hypothetical protein
MYWILPLSLVLLAVLAIGAAHFFFIRWMARQPALARDSRPEDESRDDPHT